MGKKKGIVERAYSAVMGTSKKGVADPTVGKVAAITRGRISATDAAIARELGQAGTRTDLKDTGAKWDES